MAFNKHSQQGDRITVTGGSPSAEQDSKRSGAAMDTALVRPPAWRRYGPYVAAGVLVLSAMAWLLHGAGISTYRVSVDQLTIGTVRRGKFEDYIAVRATVAPLTTYYLTTEQGGVVQRVLAQDGATVKAGQPLIVLSNTTLRLQVASRDASTANQINAIENTRLQLEDARFRYQQRLLDIEHQIAVIKGKLARDTILLHGQAIAPTLYAQEQEQYRYEQKLRAATIASSNAEERVRHTEIGELRRTLVSLKNDLAIAKASLAALTIRAPIGGQLTALNARVGESKSPGAVLGQVDSLDRFKLTAQVDEFYLGRIALGQVARFAVGNHNYRAAIVKIHPKVTNGTFKVDLHFKGAVPAGITVGQAIDTRLELGGASSSVLLPNGPFFQDTGGTWAFVLAPDGKYATRRNIELGQRNPDYVEVLHGLSPGEKVIISSYQGFRTVQRVQLTPSHGN
jgi:HlyD family secretion protein